MNQLVNKNQERHLQLGSVSLPMPFLVQSHGPQASRRFIEFFTAHIRNRNTREAYGRAVRDFFDWCDGNGVGPLIDIEAVHIAAYIEQLTDLHAPQTVKQKLAAIKALFDFLVTGGVLTANPASAVRGPRYSTRKGTTPILMPDEAKQLIRSIPTDTISGLRDRAIISTMIYSFARVSATLFISERTKEGLASAKANGKLLGRPKGSLGRSKLEGREQEIQMLLDKGVSKASIAKITDVSRTNLLHFIRTRQLGEV